MAQPLKAACGALLLGAALGTFAPLRAAEPADAVREGVQRFEQGCDDEARALLLPAASAKPPDAVAAFYLGRIAMRQDDAGEAAKWFERAVKQDERSSACHDWLGRAYGRQAQRASVLRQPFLARKVKAHFDRAVELDPDNLDAREDLLAFYTQAPAVMGGSMEKAREQAAEIARRDPYRGALARARSAEAAKDPSAAEREYRAAIAAFPDSAGPPLALGLFLARVERYDQAFAAFDEILARKPGDLNALYQIGRTGALSGQRLDRAEQALKQFLAAPRQEDTPRPAAAHWRLGMVYEKQGRRDLARQEYQAAASLQPSLEDARKALARLK